MSLHHIDGPDCPNCEDKLKSTHPFLIAWFKWLLPQIPHLHIADAYRNKEQQDAAVSSHHSKLAFPLSSHNHTDDQGNPLSAALDLFQQINGVGHWDSNTYAKIKELTELGSPFKLRYGQDWHGDLRDEDHFELVL